MKPIPGFDGYLVTQDGQVMGRHGRQREVAKMFAVSQSTIHLIGKGETWAHVKGASWRKN
jgi:hypothetical protein